MPSVAAIIQALAEAIAEAEAIGREASSLGLDDVRALSEANVALIRPGLEKAEHLLRLLRPGNA